MTSQRVKLTMRGAVQGVGFRPFIYRLAHELGVSGSVCNSTQGVVIEAEAEGQVIKAFIARMKSEKPPRARIEGLEEAPLVPTGLRGFSIGRSDSVLRPSTLILPDIATCPECLAEIFDRRDRRYLYPFTNCTNCGPRFSIIEELPYDRENTSMKSFVMCPDCRQEYLNPGNRRFHAEPTACPVCGPRLELWTPDGQVLSQDQAALLESAEAIRTGKIVALKGIGGFQLITAIDGATIRRLRQRKHRPEKPFALMYPDLGSVRGDCVISELEARLLESPEAPIVLVQRRGHFGKEPGTEVFKEIAPGNPYLGVMLPYSPLHHILLRGLNAPVVATSGNRANEPICIAEQEALKRLAGIADLFLVHNRPIVRPIDDSVSRMVAGKEQVLRRARGYAPLPVYVEANAPPTVAFGGHLKNTVALALDGQVILSQHLGDLESVESREAFQNAGEDLQRMYGVSVQSLVCDLHPDYVSTQYAARVSDRKVLKVQHHYAHVLSCMAENRIAPPVLGICWDGTGLGTDGTIWGGEFLIVDERKCRRAAHFRYFPLPGGETAIEEPRRSALGLLYELLGNNVLARDDLAPSKSFSRAELALLGKVLTQKINTPRCCSVGRLFDAVASLLDLRQKVSFEGQAAMDLEFKVLMGVEEYYPFEIPGEQPWQLDWGPMVRQLLEEMRIGCEAGLLAARFHNTLVEMAVAVARKADEKKVALSGGCFQNKYLSERLIQRLEAEGFSVYCHSQIPPNDGGLSLGQILAASRAADSEQQTFRSSQNRFAPLHEGHRKSALAAAAIDSSKEGS